jgi:hypothetical protein
MAFQLEHMTAAKLTDLEVLSQKDREPDANPGIALFFSATMSNHCLTMFDGYLRSACYAKASGAPPQQQGLEGVEPVTDMPSLTAIGEALGQFGWHGELTGCLLCIDHGMGGKSDIELDDCKVSNYRIQCKEGGTVIIKFKVEAPDVAEIVFGKLSKLKSQDVKITLVQHAVEQEEID